ncbi:MAG: molybdopterin synthase sulfur carrier subunit [Thermoproteota archaeon]|nr:MAG: molybdopterin synthase sulfur carrier subunit [Candidatus Korarchaeota archaeon]
MMKVKVKFFSVLRDAAGVKEALVELRDGAKVSELLEELYFRWPKLRDERDVIVLVNGKPSSSLELKEGDEVALIPPVSGG